MKGDFSKLPFDPKKRHSRVYLQQGRVQLDSDFNELVDLLTHARRQALVDLIGAHGGPASGAGFQVSFTQQLFFDGKNTSVYWPSWKAPYFGGDPFSIEMRLIPARDNLRTGTLFCALEDSGYFLQIESSGHVQFRAIGQGEANQKHVEVALRSSRTLAPEVVNHLAITWDGTWLILYINGFADTRQRVRLPLSAVPPASHPVIIGALERNGERSDYFRGVLEEVRLWNIVRTPRALASEIYKELTPITDGLVGLIPLRGGASNEVVDLVSGRAGTFEGGASPTWEPDLRIGNGRYYVSGICCENFTEISYKHQADLPGQALPDALKQGGNWLAYLSVWERLVTPLEDPSLAEVALNGIDTSVRTRIVQQVRLIQIGQVHGKQAWREWLDLLAAENRRGLMIAVRKSSAQLLDNQLYRVEVHCSGAVFGPFGADRDDSQSLPVRQVQGDKLHFERAYTAQLPEIGQLVEYYSDLSDKNFKPGTLLVVVAKGENWIGFGANLEATAARDNPRMRPIAGLKWSSDNGALAWPVRSLETTADGNGLIQLVDAGRAAQRLTRGSWVELTHADMQLQGKLPGLVRVARIDEATRIVIQGPLRSDWQDLNRPNLRLVLWDQRGRDFDPAESTADANAPTSDLLYAGLLPAASTPLPLEKGIEVLFARRGQLRTGDYWNIPARTRLEQGIEWPSDRQGQPQPQEPHGTRRCYAPLALIRPDRNGFRIDDLRRLFSPLTRASDFTDLSGDDQSTSTSQTTHSAVTSPIAPDHDVAPAHPPAPAELPTGLSVLTSTAAPPVGFHATGLTLKAEPWSLIGGPSLRDDSAALVACTMIDRRLYAFYSNGQVWCYASEDEKWRSCKWLPTPRLDFGITALDGRIHVLGGRDDAGKKLDRHEIYDPKQDSWTEAAAMPTARDQLSVVSAMGLVFALGGAVGTRNPMGQISDRNEFYDPASGEWKSGAPLPTPRMGAAAVCVDERIHLIGGFARNLLRPRGLGTTGQHDCYQPRTGQWSRLADTPDHLESPIVTVARRTIHVLGGETLDGTRHLRYDAARNVYREAEALPERPTNRRGAGDDERIYLLEGGANGVLHRYVRDSLLYVHCKD